MRGGGYIFIFFFPYRDDLAEASAYNTALYWKSSIYTYSMESWQNSLILSFSGDVALGSCKYCCLDYLYLLASYPRTYHAYLLRDPAIEPLLERQSAPGIAMAQIMAQLESFSRNLCFSGFHSWLWSLAVDTLGWLIWSARPRSLVQAYSSRTELCVYPIRRVSILQGQNCIQKLSIR